METFDSASRATRRVARRQGARRPRVSPVPYAFVAPAVLLLVAFGVLPIVVAGFVSFTDLDIAGLANPDTVSVIGFDNYRTLFADGDFWRSLRITIGFVGFGVPSIVAISLAICLLYTSPSPRDS